MIANGKLIFMFGKIYQSYEGPSWSWSCGSWIS